MKERAFDPHRIEVSAFAKKGGELSGETLVSEFRRLSEYAAPEAPPGPQEVVTWHAHGELRPVRGQAPQVWLHLEARGALSMTCQRCLQPLRVEVEADRDLRFVEGEEAAAAEDAVSEDDVLAISVALDLEALIEDELVLSLPWVPRHDVCPTPLPTPMEPEEPESPHPFAALADLKRRLDS